MKQFFIACLLATLLSCTNEETVTEKEGFELGIDVQSVFDGEQVVVELDNEQLINAALETNHLLGVCYVEGQVKRNEFPGNHTLMVTVNNSITKIERFLLTKNRYIAIQFDPATDQITFVHSDEPFGYD